MLRACDNKGSIWVEETMVWFGKVSMFRVQGSVRVWVLMFWFFWGSDSRGSGLDPDARALLRMKALMLYFGGPLNGGTLAGLKRQGSTQTEVQCLLACRSSCSPQRH